MARLRWARIGRGGQYTCGDWAILHTPENGPGYRWTCHHPDRGEHSAGTLVAAKSLVARMEDEAAAHNSKRVPDVASETVADAVARADS